MSSKEGNVTCGKRRKCLNVKHLVIVPEPSHYILWISGEGPLPIWCSTACVFTAIDKRAGQRKNVHSSSRDAKHPRKSGTPGATSWTHDNFGSGGVCGCLRGLGLDVPGDPHWD